MCGAFLLKQV